MMKRHGGALCALGGSVLALLVASPASAQDQKIGYSSFGLSNTYTVVLAELTQKYAKEIGLDILPTVDSTHDAAKQIVDITTMIDSGIAGLMVNVVDSKAIKGALDRAEQAGVKVVATDTGPDQGFGHVAITVSVSSLRLGEEGCMMTGELMGGTGKVLELTGSFQSQVGVERSQGFNECMAANFPDIEVISQSADWVQANATNIAQTVLSTDPEVSAIFLAGDSAYLPGVLNVLRQLDRLKKVGEEGHVIITGIDGDPVALEAIREGTMDGTIGQPLTDYARYGVQYLKDALAGATFAPGPTDHNSEIIQTGDQLKDVLAPTPITAANVDDPNLWGNVTTQ